MASDGILSGPIDLDGRRRVAATYPPVAVSAGDTVIERSTGARLVVVSVNATQVVVRDAPGAQRRLRNHPGAFTVDGRAVTLVAARTADPRRRRAPRAARSPRLASRRRSPAPAASSSRACTTPSSSSGCGATTCATRASSSSASTAWTTSTTSSARFDPGPVVASACCSTTSSTARRRPAAASLRSEHVLVTGHPYVDVWQAVKPAAVGIAAWPDVPPACRGRRASAPPSAGRPARGLASGPGVVDSWTDLETPLVNAVERLIDFVTR